MSEGDLKITLIDGSTIQLMTAQEPDRLLQARIRVHHYSPFHDTNSHASLPLGVRRQKIQHGHNNEDDRDTGHEAQRTGRWLGRTTMRAYRCELRYAPLATMASR